MYSVYMHVCVFVIAHVYVSVFYAHVKEAKFRNTHCPLLGSVLVHMCYLKYFYQEATCDVMLKGNGMKRLKGEEREQEMGEGSNMWLRELSGCRFQVWEFSLIT